MRRQPTIQLKYKPTATPTATPVTGDRFWDSFPAGRHSSGDARETDGSVTVGRKAGNMTEEAVNVAMNVAGEASNFGGEAVSMMDEDSEDDVADTNEP